MTIDRSVLKLSAKASIKAAAPPAVLVTLVYVLLTSGLSQVVNLFVENPLREMTDLLEQGIDPYYVLEHVVSGGGLSLLFFVSVLLALYCAVMQVGYIGYSMRVARNQSGGYGDLISGFPFAGKIIGLGLMLSLYAFLWSIPVSAVVGVAVGLPVVRWAEGLGEAEMFGFVLFVLGPILVGIGILVALILILLMLPYALSFYALADHPEAGVFSAIRKSRELMRGNKGKYVMLMLSFLGWLLLSGLLTYLGNHVGGAIGAGILGGVLGLLVSLPLDLWLMPYMECTRINFYDALQGGAAPETAQSPIQPYDLKQPRNFSDADDPWNK